MRSDLLIIIPAYNEGKNIVEVVRELERDYPQYDYVIINDGSRDDTSRICKENGFNTVNLVVNLGLTGAFQTGLKYANIHGYRYAMQYDGDGQHLAKYITLLYEKIQEGYDIVIGSRFKEGKKPFSMRMLGSRLIGGAIALTTGVRLADPTSGMRMFNMEMIKEFSENINYGPEPDTVSYLLKNGVQVAEVQVEMQERLAGKSYLNITGSVMYMLRMLSSIILVQNFRKRTGGNR